MVLYNSLIINNNDLYAHCIERGGIHILYTCGLHY